MATTSDLVSCTRPPRGLRSLLAVSMSLLTSAAMVVLPVASAGCASSTKPTAAARPNYLEDYTAGNYSAALASASVAARNTKNSEEVREQASLIAGEAAHAMDRNAEASTWLYKVSGSKNQLVRGKAQATLGLIALEDGNMTRAAELLTAASGDLSGDESARCAMYAGDAYRASNREAEASKSYRKAMEVARSDSSVREDIQERLSGKTPVTGTTASGGPPVESSKPPFTLQLAAFSSPQKASQHASKVRAESIRQAMGAPHVVPVFRGGKILYSVRVGTFASRIDADRAKGRFKGAMVISVGA